MKRRYHIFLTVFLSLVLALSGCAAADVSGQATDLMAGIQASEQPAGPVQPDENIRQAINRFSAALFQVSAENKGNIMISPASVYLALAMTLNGADGETKAALLKVLTDQGLTVDMINKGCRDWMTLLTKTGSKTTLVIADSIWYDQNFSPSKPFLQTNADYYAAGVRKLDFKDKGTPAIINDWVKEATNGTIDKIVESINPDIVMYLINAIYFKSDWQAPFEQNETRNQTFNTPNGAVETAFLHRNGKMGYFSGHDASGIMLPYDDGQYAYFALLPDGQMTPREWLARQEQSSLLANIAGMMSQKADFTVELAMPKFESRYDDSLRNELTRLGLEIAFDPNRADFSQMNEQHTKNLFISEIKHKTFVRVDEKGTEAAAVTSVEVGTTAIPVSDKQLTFDRPFLYGIMDLKTGTPLFLGIMEDPAVK
ncbi:MAG TPA: serpin family protein [Desulfitobacteriaceae bacterium]|nr:serpin family protein [Desulfitobacteriaceae bacterium]